MANREYITTLERLQQVAVIELLPMDGYAPYSDYEQAAGERLGESGKPQLVIAFTFKIDSPMGFRAGAQVVYAVTKDEWNDILNDVPTYCESAPRVYVVDGARYTTGI